MKLFAEPAMKVEEFRVEDVITTSAGDTSTEVPTAGPNGGPIG